MGYAVTAAVVMASAEFGLCCYCSRRYGSSRVWVMLLLQQLLWQQQSLGYAVTAAVLWQQPSLCYAVTAEVVRQQPSLGYAVTAEVAMAAAEFGLCCYCRICYGRSRL